MEEIDPTAQEVLGNIFGTVRFNLVYVQKQKGGSDCGLFAIAISTTISYGKYPTMLLFDQAAMCSHLVIAWKRPDSTIMIKLRDQEVPSSICLSSRLACDIYSSNHWPNKDTKHDF